MKRRIIKIIEGIEKIKLASKRFNEFWDENRIDASKMLPPSNYREKFFKLLKDKSKGQAETKKAETRGAVACLESISGIAVTMIAAYRAIASNSIENGQYEQVLFTFLVTLSSIIYFGIEGYFGMELLAAPRHQEQVQPTGRTKLVSTE